MVDPGAVDAALITFSCFGGTALIIWTSMAGKIARIKAEAEARRMSAAPLAERGSDTSVLAEVKALRQQIEQMQSTGHQFDISFDEALNRLEGRINRLETKSAVSTVAQTDAPNTLRNGQP